MNRFWFDFHFNFSLYFPFLLDEEIFAKLKSHFKKIPVLLNRKLKFKEKLKVKTLDK